MVLSVHQMELAPLLCSERAYYRMFRDWLGSAEPFGASLNNIIHARNVFEDLRGQLMNRRAAGKHAFRRLAPLGEIS